MTTEIKDHLKSLHTCKNQAQKIMKKLDTDDIRKKLNAIAMLERLPDIATDESIRDLKYYAEIKGILKQLYIEVARSIINILQTESNFIADADNSFNYSEPLEPLLAAEYIKVLPNAYIGGPMKAGISHPNLKVKKIVIDYYNSLPSEIKYSEIFPNTFRQVIRNLKAQQ